jgi:hypothetical protein
VLQALLTRPQHAWDMDEVVVSSGVSRPSTRLRLDRFRRRDYVRLEESCFVLVDVEDAKEVLSRRSSREV